MTKKVIETTNGWYMENEKAKVELEDIVGLVQTDDSTNSVQLKKEAQLSICEKRLIELEKENEQLKQFKENVFDLIDKNIKETKELFEDGKIDLISYNSAMIILIGLKEELKGDV